MLRFLSLLLMVGVAVLLGFIWGRSAQSDEVASASVANVCRLADTALGRNLRQDQVDQAVQNMSDLFRLNPDDRAVLAHSAAASKISPRCTEALSRIEPPPPLLQGESEPAKAI